VIVNRTYTFDRGSIAAVGDLAAAVRVAVAGEALRWFVSAADAATVKVEVTECTELPPAAFAPAPALPPSGRAVVISLVPTGVGCALGGYAGDAAPATALLAAAADLVVTNPNAVNASNFINAGDRVAYTEGYSLNLFATGAAPLYRSRSNRIGVIVERADDACLDEVFNVVNAVRAVYGSDVVDCVVTDGPAGTRCVRGASGAYGGHVAHPDVLVAAGRRLIDAGATALAVTTNVRGLSPAEYARHFAGAHPNPVGGAEAVVSHLLTRTLAVPTAHAPMINFKDIGPGQRVVDARAAGEFVSTSGLACVLLGLRQAPQLVPRSDGLTAEPIRLADVIAVVAPATALGCAPVASALMRGTPVVAVRENETILDVSAGTLGWGGVVEVDSYLAAAGVVLALRQGISLESVRRPLAAFGENRAASRPSASAAPANGSAPHLTAAPGRTGSPRDTRRDERRVVA
jgi:hypothetical protein